MYKAQAQYALGWWGQIYCSVLFMFMLLTITPTNGLQELDQSLNYTNSTSSWTKCFLVHMRNNGIAALMQTMIQHLVQQFQMVTINQLKFKLVYFILGNIFYRNHMKNIGYFIYRCYK